ncbi:MAG: leucine-rich repeat domain-containing protein [Sedimentisphaerales bacterium]|nr:leucine-rich repeat domain-containing protein [Sedimentisphaerales bacterium]
MKTKTLLLVCCLFTWLLIRQSTALAEEPVNIPDPNLKAAIEEELGLSDPNATDMLALTSLSAYNLEISDLTGLEFATNMQYLSLPNNQISDISPLAGLTNLISLDLYYNQISDIAPIKELTNLISLSRDNNQISDISALLGLTNLIDISLGFNTIKNISSLSNITNLKDLYLSYNYVRDISALTEMTNLERLYLHGNPLDMDAFTTYIPLIYQNNPEIYISYEYKPKPPKTISASDGAFIDKVHISWDSVYSMNGDTLYKVYRSDSETEYPTAICDWQTETSYNDTDVEGCKKYYYWIKASGSDFSSFDTGWAIGEYILNISSTDGGSVTEPGEGDFLYTGCDTNITVQAIAEPNYYFTNWSGTAVYAGKVQDCISANTTVIADDNYTLKANFRTDANTIYVDDDGPADFNNIQAAVDYANDGDTVLVADGIYRNNNHDINMINKSILLNGIYRNIINYDIKLINKSIILKSQNGPQNCIIDLENDYRNSIRVQDGNSILEGFTITNAREHAISCYRSDPLIIECVITSNYSRGILCEKSNPIIADCVISKNRSSGIYSTNSNLVVMRCQINNNYNGGIYNSNDRSWPMLSVMNCTITGNYCRNNYGGGGGGGIYCTGGEVNITNCTISGNRAEYYGGGIFFGVCNGEVRNSIITNNFASLVNNIFMGIYPDHAGCPDVTLNITYSVIENEPNSINVPYCTNTLAGEWMGFDPLFADPGYWDPNGTPEDANDDFWVEGDYHLKSQTGRWNPDTLSWVQDDVTSCGIDSGDPNSPIGLEPSPNGDYINIGAYGGTDEASLSPPWHLHFLSKASNPQPGNNAVDIKSDAILSWTPGRGAVLHDVYFSKDFNDVNDATISNPMDTLVSMGQDYNYYETNQLEQNQTYYWRIDEVNESLITAKGNIWKFQTDVSFKDSYNPYPANGSEEVYVFSELSWNSGLGAVAHDVYLGTDFNDVNAATISNPLGVLVSKYQDSNSYIPNLLEHNLIYFWRVDEIDSNGFTTKGEIWSFDTYAQKERGCFTGQTPVWIDGKSVPISKAQAGQSINESSNVEEVQEHNGTFILYDIILENGNYITVADEHYFMSESGRWISSRNLEPGMKLRAAAGLIKIKSITKQPEPFTGKVYNLKIKDSDTYMVGQDNIIVRDY